MTTISEAIDIVKQAIKDDPEYYQSWINSIAQAFQDESKREIDDEGIRTRSIRLVSQIGAKNFIDSFIS